MPGVPGGGPGPAGAGADGPGGPGGGRPVPLPPGAVRRHGAEVPAGQRPGPQPAPGAAGRAHRGPGSGLQPGDHGADPGLEPQAGHRLSHHHPRSQAGLRPGGADGGALRRPRGGGRGDPGHPGQPPPPLHPGPAPVGGGPEPGAGHVGHPAHHRGLHPGAPRLPLLRPVHPEPAGVRLPRAGAGKAARRAAALLQPGRHPHPALLPEPEQVLRETEGAGEHRPDPVQRGDRLPGGPLRRGQDHPGPHPGGPAPPGGGRHGGVSGGAGPLHRPPPAAGRGADGAPGQPGRPQPPDDRPGGGGGAHAPHRPLPGGRGGAGPGGRGPLRLRQLFQPAHPRPVRRPAAAGGGGPGPDHGARPAHRRRAHLHAGSLGQGQPAADAQGPPEQPGLLHADDHPRSGRRFEDLRPDLPAGGGQAAAAGSQRPHSGGL